MFKKLIYFVLSTLILISCQSEKSTNSTTLPEAGEWRGLIHTMGQDLPFNFTVETSNTGDLTVVLKNGKEEIPIYDTKITGDSIYIPMHIFDADLVASFTSNQMIGYWRKNYAQDYTIPFSARFGDSYRFIDQSAKARVNIDGRWEVYFENNAGKKLAIGEFKQNGNKVSGTFLRPSGDYRFLVGNLDGNKLFLSTFDGEHAYLFTGIVEGDEIKGDFYSGKTRHDTWTAIRNDTITLPDPHLLTFLKDGYETVDFELPDMNEEIISLKDAKFANKVVIVQVFGTWCPNCMDETKFLSEWYNNNKDRGIEIVALAFERKDDFQYAKTRIEKLKKRFKVEYDFLFGGKSDKASTSRALPMLDGAISFPTTIFIDREGKVRQIHTGFSGPGTGEYYEQFVVDFNLFMDKLLEE